MGTVEQAAQVDFITFGLTALLIMAGVVGAIKIVEEFSKIIKKPVWWIKKKDEDHQAILALKKQLDEHLEESDAKISQLSGADVEIKQNIAQLNSDVSKLTDMFVNKQISDMRFDIVDVASAITLGRQYSVEQLAHVLRIYDDYMKILGERKLTNGQVDMSIEVVKEEYRRLTQQCKPRRED